MDRRKVVMKKFIVFCICLLLGLNSAFAWKEVAARALPVVGAVGMVQSVEITPLQRGTAGVVGGMPFDIMGSDVAYTPTIGRGRLIGYWTMLTNYIPATLQVTVQPMQGNANKDVLLDYTLFIRYSYSCEADGGGVQKKVEGTLPVSTQNGNPGTNSVVFELPEGASVDSYISIINNPIRFMFTRETTDRLEAATNDDYYANVLFEIISST